LYCDSFFFFQAEDGIRDFHVTGVQTCALPIWLVGPFFVAIPQRDVQFSGNFAAPFFLAFLLGFLNGLFDSGQGFLVALRDHNARSEERRVGKECRSWWWPCQVMNKVDDRCE